MHITDSLSEERFSYTRCLQCSVANVQSAFLFLEEWNYEIIHYRLHFSRYAGHNDEIFSVSLEEISWCSA